MWSNFGCLTTAFLISLSRLFSFIIVLRPNMFSLNINQSRNISLYFFFPPFLRLSHTTFQTIQPLQALLEVGVSEIPVVKRLIEVEPRLEGEVRRLEQRRLLLSDIGKVLASAHILLIAFLYNLTS